MSTQDHILTKLVSFQENAWSELSSEMLIRIMLEEIKSGKYKEQVMFLRSLLECGNREGYNSHKKNLPAITFCGTFKGRRKKENIKAYNSIIVLDVDKLNYTDLENAKKSFSKDPFIFSFWESPSREGLKGLVYINYNFEFDTSNIDEVHKGAFKKVTIYIKEKYDIQLDLSGSDITRLCFLSFDPFLVLKTEINVFNITEHDILQLAKTENKNETGNNDIKSVIHVGSRDALYNPKDKNNPSDRYTIQLIIKYLYKKKFSITYSYEEWYRVAMAIANSFTYDIGEKYFLKLSFMDTGKFNEKNCKGFLHNCYESRNGAIKFNTIVYYASKKGYIIKKQRERGSEAVNENLSQVSSS
jgi:hypothetical protein